MNWLTTLKKGALGLATFGVAYLVSNPGMIDKIIPGDIEKMTIGGVVAAGLVMLSNWLKNKTK